MPYLGIFGVNFENNYCHIWNQQPQIYQIAKFCKNTKLKTCKNALFRCFCGRILNIYSHIWNQHPQICQILKLWTKIKVHKFLTKYALSGYLFDRNFKEYCQIWKHRPQICLIPNFSKKTKTPKFETKNALFGNFWGKLWK